MGEVIGADSDFQLWSNLDGSLEILCTLYRWAFTHTQVRRYFVVIIAVVIITLYKNFNCLAT